MFNKGKFNYIMVSIIVLMVAFSGCVSKTPAPTPAPTSSPVPTQVAPVATTITPTAPPAIKVTSYPSSVNSDTNITIRWEVSGGAQGEISSTEVIWGYKSGSANVSDYSKASKMQTGKTPQGFSIDMKAPSGGNFYFRAHAMVDGVNVYSPEYQITIIAPMGGGGGY